MPHRVSALVKPCGLTYYFRVVFGKDSSQPHPGQERMSHVDSFLTILFADISESTKLYEQHGNIRALEIVTHALSVLQHAALTNYGSVIKTIGDEVMCSFLEAEDAIRAACEMNRELSQDPVLQPYNVGVRIGLHLGDVLYRENDIYGDAVNVASRAVNLAGRGQIITTQETLELAGKDMALQTRYLGKIKVKGKEKHFRFYEVLWCAEDLADMGATTRINDSALDSLVGTRLLTLTYKDEKHELGLLRKTLRFGRSEQNDLYLPSGFVSKRHATIEFTDDQFVITDHSANGTFVQPHGKDDIFLHRNGVILFGTGIISPGQDPREKDAEIIQYIAT